MKKLIENRDIIIVGLQPYDLGIGSNCINIAEVFSEHNRVLYVNYPLDRQSMIKQKDKPFYAKRIKLLNERQNHIVQLKDNLWNLYPNTVIESANWIPSTTLFKLITKINNKRYAKTILQAAHELNFKDYILFNDSDMFRSFYLKEFLKPACTVYYSRDNLQSVPYWRKHGKTMEPEIMKKSDLVCANSTYLAKEAKKYNVNSFYVGQGCDVTAFNKELVKVEPNDIAAIKKPIIGYIGALYTLRLDIEIIRYVAENKPEWNIVLIGPEDDGFKSSSLHDLKNVHFLGLKNGSALPAYLNCFDVAINPQILNETTIGNYPRKIDEYLAMGKPVVATKTVAMEIFKDYVSLAENKEEYVSFIEDALRSNSQTLVQQRIEFAQSHTWENSVTLIYDSINQIINSK